MRCARRGGGDVLLVAWCACVCVCACACSGARNAPAITQCPRVGPTSRAPRASAQRLPAADVLFTRDHRWLGGDAATSVSLGGSGDAARRLWLFGDSFIARDASRERRRAKLVRNSVAIQRGDDPRRATMRFFAGGDAAAPGDFFAHAQPRRWYWPGPAAQLGNGAVVVMLYALRTTGSGALDFRVTAGAARLYRDTRGDDPRRWQAQQIALPPSRCAAQLGTGALLVEGGYLYNYATAKRPGGHDAYLARWPLAAARRGALGRPSWWNGRRFVPDGGAAAHPVTRAVQVELTVHRDAALGRYVMVHTVGFGAAHVAARSAPTPHGPWSAPRLLLRPAEGRRSGALIYAAKAHPGLRGGSAGTLLVTYNSNHRDLSVVLADRTLYVPRFVTVRWRR